MAEMVALSELSNQRRPARRLDKTYGRKKPVQAQTRAMHFDLFGGGDENRQASEMERLTTVGKHRTTSPDRHSAIVVVPTPGPTETAQRHLHPHRDPRLRGRRKTTASRRMAVLVPEQLQALQPLLALSSGSVQDFQEFGRGIGKKYCCTKLGEGAFADVFKLTPKDPGEAKDVADQGGLVVKVIPFNLKKSHGDDDSADLDSVTREVRVLQTVDQLHGFARCRAVHVVSGTYPDVLLDAFQAFKVTDAHEAINSDPTANPPSDQLYALIEMNDAGQPCAKLHGPSAFQVFDVFWKTAMALAGAEELVEFEHRDLHNGNICYRSITADDPQAVTQELVTAMTHEPASTLGLSHLDITILDYTLSRAKITDDAGQDVIIFDPITFWEDCDADTSDPSDKMQYATYRKVRDWAKTAEAKARATCELDGTEYEEVDKYSRYLPKSNVMWLRYLLADLWHKSARTRGTALPNSSAAARRLQLRLWRTMGAVWAYLNTTIPTLMPESAQDLIKTCVELGWLEPADIAAFAAQSEE